MFKEAVPEYQDVRLENQHAILPLMTMLFVDGLQAVRPTAGNEDWFKRIHCATDIRTHLVPGLTAWPVTEFIAAGSSTEAPLIEELAAVGPQNRHQGIRAMIRGISYQFNNLLMGIWGMAGLIRMQLDECDPRHARMVHIERLIQSGAFLIHMVLGYLGERRLGAKRIRLEQLVTEIKNEIRYCGGDEKSSWNLESRLKWASRVQRPRTIAGSTARVLEVLFQAVEAHCSDISLDGADETNMRHKMATIATLVTRGFQITHRLRLYAGALMLNITRFRLDALIRRLTPGIKRAYPKLQVRCRKAGPVPVIEGDRGHLEYAVWELISNAAAAMPGNGDLLISIQTLVPKALTRRCGRPTRRDYVVIGIADNGCGIDQSVQRRMFDPFYSFPSRHGRKGLGLASVDGIMAAHNGFIQVQSEPGAGSTFKLYLPVRRQSIDDPPKRRAEETFQTAGGGDAAGCMR